MTLTTLLTHTAGFEERTVGRATLTPSGSPSLDTYLATRMPERVTAPGTFYNYSNYGFALAGDVVESVSGQPFDQSVAREIFKPLGMDHSSFAQPLPDDLADSAATGYDLVGTRPSPAPFEYFSDPPAEAMSTAAADMARFMIFQLDERPNAGRVLSARAIADMHALHFHASPDADFNGMVYGFNRYQRNGVWIPSKEGDIRGFSSYLALLPEQHLDYFVGANTNNSAWMQDIERRFVSRYFPMPPATSPITSPSQRGSLAAFTGISVPNRFSRSTVEKLRTLTQQIEIADVGNGQIDVRYPDGGDVRLTRVGRLAFANVYEGGVYHRIPWYEARSIQLGIAVSFALLFFNGLSLGLLPRPSRQRSDRPIPVALPVRGPCLVGLTHTLARILCGVNLVFLVAIAVILYSATATQNLDYSWVTYGPPRLVYVVLCLPLVTVVLAIGIVVGIALAGRGHAWRGAAYRYAVVVAIVQIGFIPFLVHWNLLGFHA